MLSFIMGNNKDNRPTIKNMDLKFSNLEGTFDELSVLEKSLQEAANQSEFKSLKFQDIDFSKMLDSIIYTAEIDNKLSKLKKVITNIQTGFKNLICTQDSCIEKATFYFQIDKDTPAKIYCDNHSNEIDPLRNKLSRLDKKLNKQILNLNYLERLLILVQENIGNSINDKIYLDPNRYNRIKSNIESLYKSLTTILNEMTEKTIIVADNESIPDKITKFELLLSVKVDCKNCAKIVQQLLGLIFELKFKPIRKEKEKVKENFNFNKNIEQSVNENIDSFDLYSNQIDEQEIRLCKIPTQSLKSLKNIESKVTNMSRVAIANQKNSKKIAGVISKLKDILQREINQRNKDNSEEKKCQDEIKKDLKDKEDTKSKEKESINKKFKKSKIKIRKTIK